MRRPVPRERGDAVARRKSEHLHLAATGNVGSGTGPGWADIRLVHHGLPRADVAAIGLDCTFLGRHLRAPLAIAAMTGGHADARTVNTRLGAAAERFGLAMGVGSQRAALRRPALVPTYTAARRAAPTAFLIANVGAAQLVPQDSGPPLTSRQLSDVVAMIDANALAIHLNLLEETIQPEGDRRVAGIREALARAVASVEVPLIAKETGAGLSRDVALELRELGVRALDVGGAGGTSFAAIEAARAAARGDAGRAKLGAVYREWGVPTAVSVVASRAAGLPIIATGGVRTGLDAAKALALGATLVGVGRPLLLAALEGDRALDAWITQFLEELRVAVFLTGGHGVGDLAGVPKVILGPTRSWIEDLGYDDALAPAHRGF
ncbi:MAG TPA: type 2 isopentenyl-diphosphate Delta-isomerase [bacterium]|nr:type 2 isopentenyl-diphosphate Delta-isomerase [bacterium]